MGLLEKECEFVRTEKGIVVPLIREPSSVEMKNLRAKLDNVEIEHVEFQLAKNTSRSLRDLAPVPQSLRHELPRSFDIIGEIAIVEIPQTLITFSEQIGNAIIEMNPHVRLVIQKSSDVTGTFRTRKYEVVAGNGSTETVYHEFACHYNLDVAEVYFNPRLSHERMRIARQVDRDEVVVDMFAGVGPYSILIAKTQTRSIVYSIDINPTAIRYLKENAFTNRVADRVIPLQGDAEKLSVKQLRNVADRVIMNLPSDAGSYVNAASRILKTDGGRIHFYLFAHRETSIDSIKDSFRTIIEAQGRAIESFEYCGAIKEVSPSRVQIAIDAAVR
jgi:tRNA (guanine37-N1)-methyltransferase